MEQQAGQDVDSTQEELLTSSTCHGNSHKLPKLINKYRFFFNFFNVYLFLIEHEWGRGRERGRPRIRSRLQALSCQHRARRGARTHRLRDHDLSRSRTLNRLSHPGALTNTFFFFKADCNYLKDSF